MKKKTIVGKMLIVLGIVVLCFIVSSIFILTVRKNVDDYNAKQDYADKVIQAYCDASPKIREDIKYQTKYFMSINRPEAPYVSQGWAFSLSKEQVIALMRVADGSDPGCPWPSRSGR